MGVTSGNDEDFIDFSKEVLLEKFEVKNIKQFSYRPFDSRFINYDQTALARARFGFMKNLVSENYSICLIRRTRSENFGGCLLVKNLVDKCITSSLDNANIFPLYLYETDLFSEKTRTPNLSEKIIAELASRLNLRFSPEKSEEAGSFCPLDVLDYVYAVLHSPSYRAKYKEFLKIDFPRVPWPTGAGPFFALGKLGGELRGLHLLESPVVENFITSYPIAGDNVVQKPKYDLSPDPSPKGEGRKGKVFINATQYFEGVPEAVWSFYIGGYQPAQKWLKDRAGRALGYEDILHYQKMVVALSETGRVMGEIDGVGV